MTGYSLTRIRGIVEKGMFSQEDIMLWRHYILPTDRLRSQIECFKPNLVIIGRQSSFIPAVAHWWHDTAKTIYDIYGNTQTLKVGEGVHRI
jgi:hypothetical protein